MQSRHANIVVVVMGRFRVFFFRYSVDFGFSVSGGFRFTCSVPVLKLGSFVSKIHTFLPTPYLCDEGIKMFSKKVLFLQKKIKNFEKSPFLVPYYYYYLLHYGSFFL